MSLKSHDRLSPLKSSLKRESPIQQFKRSIERAKSIKEYWTDSEDELSGWYSSLISEVAFRTKFKIK
jgi:hypothetical protein